MQINSIGNTNFGLKFTDNMNKMFDEGKKTAISRNPRNEKVFEKIKQEIADSYTNQYSLDVQEFPHNLHSIVLVDPKQNKHDVMTLIEDETIDRAYIGVLKNKLQELKSMLAKVK